MSEAEQPSLIPVIAAWVPAMGVLGTAVGTLLQITGSVGSVAPTALRAAGIGLVLGAVAGMVNQRRASRRPPLPDGRGVLRHHGDAWVLVAPLVIASVGFLGLVVLATVQASSALLGGGFLAASLMSAGFVRPVWTKMRLARAAEAMSVGDRGRARTAWLSLTRHVLCTRPGRIQAHINLGLSSVVNGDLDAATHHYSQVIRGQAAPFAQTGLALVRTLKGDYSEAEAALSAASSATRAVQGEVDGVRLLLVLRRDGPAAAVRLGESIRSPASGSLFLGILATAYRGVGRVEESEAIWSDGVEDSVRSSGLDRTIRELCRDPEEFDLLTHSGE